MLINLIPSEYSRINYRVINCLLIIDIYISDNISMFNTRLNKTLLFLFKLKIFATNIIILEFES
jgi:hypothetical protein